MAVRVLISGHEVPVLNSRRIAEYSLGIVEALRDPERAHEEFTKAVSIIRASLDRFAAANRELRDGWGRNPPYRLRAFTDQLIQDLRAGDPVSDVVAVYTSDASSENVEYGQLLWYDDWRNYGFIVRSGGEGDIFVHQSELAEVPWRLRVPGTPVRYCVEKNPRFDNPNAIKATNVTLASSG